MNARARHARAVIRNERRRRREERQRARVAAYVADRRRRSLANQEALGLWPAPGGAYVARLIMQHYAIGEGMAFVPHNDSRLPRAGEHQERLGPSGAGKTYTVPSGLPPVNAAYWINEQEDDGS